MSLWLISKSFADARLLLGEMENYLSYDDGRCQSQAGVPSVWYSVIQISKKLRSTAFFDQK